MPHQASSGQLIQCILCETKTLEDILRTHIQFNHMIQKESIVDMMFQLHYPPVSEKTIRDMIRDLCGGRKDVEIGEEVVVKEVGRGGRKRDRGKEEVVVEEEVGRRGRKRGLPEEVGQKKRKLKVKL